MSRSAVARWYHRRVLRLETHICGAVIDGYLDAQRPQFGWGEPDFGTLQLVARHQYDALPYLLTPGGVPYRGRHGVADLLCQRRVTLVRCGYHRR